MLAEGLQLLLLQIHVQEKGNRRTRTDHEEPLKGTRLKSRYAVNTKSRYQVTWDACSDIAKVADGGPLGSIHFSRLPGIVSRIYDEFLPIKISPQVVTADRESVPSG